MKRLKEIKPFNGCPCHNWCGDDCTCYPYKVIDENEKQNSNDSNSILS